MRYDYKNNTIALLIRLIAAIYSSTSRSVIYTSHTEIYLLASSDESPQDTLRIYCTCSSREMIYHFSAFV